MPVSLVKWKARVHPNSKFWLRPWVRVRVRVRFRFRRNVQEGSVLRENFLTLTKNRRQCIETLCPIHTSDGDINDINCRLWSCRHWWWWCELGIRVVEMKSAKT